MVAGVIVSSALEAPAVIAGFDDVAALLEMCQSNATSPHPSEHELGSLYGKPHGANFRAVLRSRHSYPAEDDTVHPSVTISWHGQHVGMVPAPGRRKPRL